MLRRPTRATVLAAILAAGCDEPATPHDAPALADATDDLTTPIDAPLIDAPTDAGVPKEPIVAGTLETPVPRVSFDAGASPPFDRTWRITTHNSYWVHRSDQADLFASGVQQRLLDQLLFDHARGVEIDVHRAPEARRFEVFHSTRGINSQCATLDDCVRMLRLFHLAVPRHDVVTVVVELKELSSFNFDEAHTPDDLDAPFRALLADAEGSWLFTPRDLLARCPVGTSLRECVRSRGWPDVESLRGRFLVTVLGNWRYNLTTAACRATRPPEDCPARPTDAIVGHGPAGWVTYASWGGGVSGRAAFPHRSNFVRLNDGADTEQVPPGDLHAAEDASVFLQVEDLADPSVPGFLADHGVVRGADSFGLADQRARVAAGFQILQTDHPWSQLDDRGPAQPTRAASTALVEPGERLLLRGPADVTRAAFAYATVDAAGCTLWEAVPAGTRAPTDPRYPNAARGGATVCLRASADAADEGADAVSLCRRNLADEEIRVAVRVRRGGIETVTELDDATARDRADVLSLRVCDGRVVTASVRGSASDEPVMVFRDDGARFARPLLHQGLAATRDALFVHTRRNDQPVRGEALRVVVPALAGQPTRADARLLDLSSP